jgi:hypothetical protein
MVSTLLVFAVVLLSLVLAGALLWRRSPEIQSAGDWEAKKHEIDVRAFEALIDINDERRLRHCLPSKRFHHFQRRRTRLALRFLQLMEENAGMLMSLAQLARTKGDPVLTQKADEMIAVALQLRLKLLLARLYLSAKWLFPSWTVSLPTVEPWYRELLNCVMQFQQYGQQALT